ncbi:MAG TPA: S53 family peptidase [Steroidobacteraceae bacterium]
MKSVKFRLLTVTLSTLGLAAALTASNRAESSAEQLNVPHWAESAQKVASAAESQRVSIAAFLRFRNQDALQAMVAEQSRPGSAQYAKYLTPTQFRAQFAPKAADVARVQRTLEKLGFHVDYTPASGLFVQASGTIAQVKAAFGVSQNLYAVKGRTLRANAETPKIPAAIADVVGYIAGLDDSATLRTPNHVRRDGHSAALAKASVTPNAGPPVAADIPSPVCSSYWGDHTGTLSTPAAPYPATLPWLICGYTPQQVRQAYGANHASQDGTGVRVGIVDIYASPTIVNDANTYSTNHGLPQLTSANFRQIVPPSLYYVPASDPCGPQGWYGEETLDVEAVHSMAPGASIVYTGDVCTDPLNAALYNLIDNHVVDIVTNSYGYNGEVDSGLTPGFIAYENQFFLQAAAEGMSILFSSGDDGDLVLAGDQTEASGSWDATSPYVTAVGGTSLALTDSTGNKTEWGWGTQRVLMNNVTVPLDGKNITTSGPALPFAWYAGSGGGPSLIELAPPYQADVPYSLSGFTTNSAGAVVALGAAYRVTPDIAMFGDPYTGFLIGETYTKANDPVLDGGCTSLSSTTEYCEGDIGGTSLATPTFAGVLALVNQARLAEHKAMVGFVNPALYSMTRGPWQSTAPISIVHAPVTPTALLRGYANNLNELRVVTVNSAPNPNHTSGNGTPAVIEGADSSLRVTNNYNNVTGLGTPNIPAMIETFASF